MSNAIEVDGVYKKFRAGRGRHYSSVAEFITRKSGPVADNDPARMLSGWFWALQDCSFSVETGKVLGLVGGNGSGKSTMLKLLTRIMAPTRGSIRMTGRVGSLLEVGTGFHPELSGRDNVYFSGAVLGMRRSDIARSFDEIVEFSGCGSFIDTPIKHYSSGMSVRLAFSVASFLETDILLIDEVLAVGDADFQRRCLGKMSDVAGSGRTIVFVSHNLSAVNQLCDRAIWFDRGVVRSEGPTDQVVSTYLRDGASMAGSFAPVDDDEGEFHLLDARVLDSEGAVTSLLDTEQGLHVRLRYRLEAPISRLSVGFLLANLDGMVMLDVRDSDDRSMPVDRDAGEYVLDCTIPGPLFTRGQYVLTFFAAVPGRGWLKTYRSAIQIGFEDLNRPLDLLGTRRLGSVRPRVDLSTHLVGEAARDIEDGGDRDAR